MAGSIVHYICAKRIIDEFNYSKEFNEALLFGTHGPDFLFFKDTDEHLGHILHANNAKKLFNDCDILLKNKSDYYKGYLYGLLLHYYIDRYVHQYVGYLVSLDNYPGRHALVEATFDSYMYKKEFKKDITTLKFSDEYKLNDNLLKEITSYFNDIKYSKSLTFDYIKECWSLMINRTDLMLKPNPVLLFLIRIYEKLFKKGTFYSSHFFTKDKYTDKFMNYEKNNWNSAIGIDNHSFDEIIEIGLNDYRKEIKKIEDCIKTNTKYEFNNPINFDGERVDL